MNALHKEIRRILIPFGGAPGNEDGARRRDFRYGGAEFAALCPETPGAATAHASHRLGMNMPLETRLLGRLAERPGISCGAAFFPADDTEEDELIRMTDDRLFACKRSHS